MRVLITGADGRLARAVMAALPDGCVSSRYRTVDDDVLKLPGPPAGHSLCSHEVAHQLRPADAVLPSLLS